MVITDSTAQATRSSTPVQSRPKKPRGSIRQGAVPNTRPRQSLWASGDLSEVGLLPLMRCCEEVSIQAEEVLPVLLEVCKVVQPARRVIFGHASVTRYE